MQNMKNYVKFLLATKIFLDNTILKEYEKTKYKYSKDVTIIVIY